MEANHVGAEEERDRAIARVLEGHHGRDLRAARHVECLGRRDAQRLRAGRRGQRRRCGDVLREGERGSLERLRGSDVADRGPDGRGDEGRRGSGRPRRRPRRRLLRCRGPSEVRRDRRAADEDRALARAKAVEHRVEGRRPRSFSRNDELSPFVGGRARVLGKCAANRLGRAIALRGRDRALRACRRRLDEAGRWRDLEHEQPWVRGDSHRELTRVLDTKLPWPATRRGRHREREGRLGLGRRSVVGPCPRCRRRRHRDDERRREDDPPESDRSSRRHLSLSPGASRRARDPGSPSSCACARRRRRCPRATCRSRCRRRARSAPRARPTPRARRSGPDRS